MESITKRDIRVSDLKRMAGSSDMKKGGILFGKEKNEITIRSSAAEYLTYVASVGDQQDSIEMRYEDENIWLTQKMMAALYDVDVRTINYHVKKIFSDSELQEDSVIRKFRITAADGKSYSTNHYSLEMIIAVGFKVNSERAVQFRKWVNQIAKDFTIKGWVLDDERLKRGTYLTEKYFDEQLERMPLNFRLEYIDENGEKQRPIMIHRVCFGSLERFIGILTEHFAGKFPVWLAPRQVKVLLVSEKSVDYGQKVYAELCNAKFVVNWIHEMKKWVI